MCVGPWVFRAGTSRLSPDTKSGSAPRIAPQSRLIDRSLMPPWCHQRARAPIEVQGVVSEDVPSRNPGSAACSRMTARCAPGAPN